jgi:hypothetical protein
MHVDGTLNGASSIHEEPVPDGSKLNITPVNQMSTEKSLNKIGFAK